MAAQPQIEYDTDVFYGSAFPLVPEDRGVSLRFNARAVSESAVDPVASPVSSYRYNKPTAGEVSAS